jgi:hypothetical protein
MKTNTYTAFKPNHYQKGAFFLFLGIFLFGNLAAINNNNNARIQTQAM